MRNKVYCRRRAFCVPFAEELLSTPLCLPYAQLLSTIHSSMFSLSYTSVSIRLSLSFFLERALSAFCLPNSPVFCGHREQRTLGAAAGSSEDDQSSEDDESSENAEQRGR